MAVLQQDLVQPVLQVLVLQTALRELTLLLRKTAVPQRRLGLGFGVLEVGYGALAGLLKDGGLLQHAVVLGPGSLRKPWELPLACPGALPHCGSGGESSYGLRICDPLGALGDVDSAEVSEDLGGL